MANILPIKAWRYNPNLISEIDQLVSPLFDVVSQKQREKLYLNELNSIHLSVPKGENPAQNAKATLQQWKDKGILLQDDIPGIYVYYQYFRLPGSQKEYCRKGFICNIQIYDWDENILLRHENTMPGSVNDRIEIMANTQLNASPTHGLYEDNDFVLEKYMDESMMHPLYETEDYQGVRDVLSVIHDAKVISLFVEHIKEKQIILADGHHRYAGSLAYKKSQQNLPGHTGNEGYNFHMMYMTNLNAEDIKVLPTHRLIKDLEHFNEDDILEQLKAWFTINKVENMVDLNEIIAGKEHTFGLAFQNNAYVISLLPGKLAAINWSFPNKIKALDMTILHYFIIEQAIGIPGHLHTTSNNIVFDRNFADCLVKVNSGEVQLAIIVNEVPMDKIKEVCFSGYTLPQKSTYFYPKVICGFLFNSIKDDEFETTGHFGL